jgi:hypothetical protein
LANVRALPGYVKRISSAAVARGETNGGFQVWPTARPVITLESGERLSIALRITALAKDAGGVTLGPGAPDSWKLKREPNGGVYWLEIPIEPSSVSSSRVVPLVVGEGGGGSREIRVQLTVNVPAESLVVTPKEIDFGEVALASVKSALKRVGIRKLVGSLHIKAISSTLPFLKLEQATMVEGSNYLIRITIESARPLKAGAYDGILVIETDEGRRVEVPMKLKLIDR